MLMLILGFYLGGAYHCFWVMREEDAMIDVPLRTTVVGALLWFVWPALEWLVWATSWIAPFFRR